MKENKPATVNPWSWIPTLYFAEGMPYIVVMSVSVIMYKRLGLSNTDIALYTSWLYLPWVIKPFWSPLVDLLKTRRWWIVTMQLLIGAGLAGVALTLQTSFFIKGTLAFFWLLAFSSATHDIAADGFYMMGLNENQQAFFVGFRTTFYRIAMITGQGLLVIAAGYLENSSISLSLSKITSSNPISAAWSTTFVILTALFLSFAVYHKFILPKAKEDLETTVLDIRSILKGFKETLIVFFNKKEIWIILAYLMFFRFGKAQLLKMATPFLLDSHQSGGLALSTSQVGLIYGTFGLIALIVGGLSGGWLASVYGLKRLLWVFVLTMNLPGAVYIYLAFTQTTSLWIIGSSVIFEQLGYGFGFTAFSLYMLSISMGLHKTSNYAFSTGIMALGMMLPGMLSGWFQEHYGYQNFFIWVLVCTIPGIVLTKFIRIDSNFGIKEVNK
ncbi:MAG: MFS transporter [Paludibacter sp.]|nr:MFS transporter [Paludibacter sp.]